MNQEPLLNSVVTALDAIIESGEGYQGLFPSLIDLHTHRMPPDLPPPIPGQRTGDRSYPGSNLMHDEPTLATLYGLSAAIGRRDYAEAADRYLQRFAAHCTHTPNGLFPWGEHAYWDLVDDSLNPQAIHDHLRQSPLWLWEKLWEYDPACVERFAAGLDCHWTQGEPLEYSRHAPMDSIRRSERHGARSCDFPRHSGFYIFDLSFAWLKTGRADFLEQIHRFLDYWWEKRFPDGGLLSESRSPEGLRPFHNVKGPGQTLSLGVSLLESAKMVEARSPELAETMRERGRIYTGGFLSAPHDLDRGIYVLGYNHVTGEIISDSPVWGSVYGIWPASYIALTCLCGYRLAGDERLLGWAESVGKQYLVQPLPTEVAVPAMDAGLAVELLADLYDISSERTWLDGGLALAYKLRNAYLDTALPRGAAGIDWYESQMGPGFLLHGLARIALLAEGTDRCPIQADYTAR